MLVSDALLISFMNSSCETMTPFLSVRSGPASVRLPPSTVTTFWVALMVLGSRARRAELPVLFSEPVMSSRLPPVETELLTKLARGPASVTLPFLLTLKNDDDFVKDWLLNWKSGDVEVPVKSVSKLAKGLKLSRRRLERSQWSLAEQAFVKA